MSSKNSAVIVKTLPELISTTSSCLFLLNVFLSFPFEQNTQTSRLQTLNWSVRWSYRSYLAMKWSNCATRSCHGSSSRRSYAIEAPIWRCYSTCTICIRISRGASCRASRTWAARWNSRAGAYPLLSPGLDIMTTILVFLTYVYLLSASPLCVLPSLWLRLCLCPCGMSTSSWSSSTSSSNSESNRIYSHHPRIMCPCRCWLY